MATKLQLKVRQMVREEFIKQILKESEEPRRFSKVWSALPKSKLTQFEKWAKQNYSEEIPEEVEDSDVVLFIDRNPSRFKAAEMVDKFLTTIGAKTEPQTSKPELDDDNDDDDEVKLDTASAKLRALEDEEEASIEADISAEEEEEAPPTAQRSHGELDYGTIGKELDISKQGAEQMDKRARNNITRFLGGRSITDLQSDPDSFEDIFGIGGKFDQITRKAADTFARLLLASEGDVEKVLTALENAKIIDKDEVLPKNEIVALQLLADLAEEGKIDVVKKLLLKDLNKPINDKNIIKTFQELVSKLVRKELNKADVESGLKPKRGRPAKTTLSAQ